MEFKAERKKDILDKEYRPQEPYKRKSKLYFLITTIIGGGVMLIFGLTYTEIFSFLDPGIDKWDDTFQSGGSAIIFFLTGLVTFIVGFYNLLRRN